MVLRVSALGAVVLSLGSASTCGADPSERTAHPRLPALAGPTEIITGPDGNVWFTERGDRIGRITPSGRLTEFSRGITRGSAPEGIAVGPDGNLWFTESEGGRIGRITPQGAVTEFSRGIGPASHPAGIAAGPDGNMWFTEYRANRIGRITPTGRVTTFALEGDGAPNQITAGPDGNLWFTDYQKSYVGRITTKGVMTKMWREGSIPNPPWDIATGADGNLWVTGLGVIWRIRPDGTARGFSTGRGFMPPSGGSTAESFITAGPDGSMWFTEADRIGRITPSGSVSVRSRRMLPGWRGLGTIGVSRITTGPDGNLWFTESGSRRIGQLTPQGRMREFPATAAIISARLRGDRQVAVRLRCPPGDLGGCRGVLSAELGPPEWDDANYRGRPTPIGARRIDLGPGVVKTVGVHLGPRGRRLLKRAPADMYGVARLRPLAPRTAGQMVIFFPLRPGTPVPG